MKARVAKQKINTLEHRLVPLVLQRVALLHKKYPKYDGIQLYDLAKFEIESEDNEKNPQLELISI